MRLIRTDNHLLEEFVDSKVPNYAILSHTWGDREVTFEEYQRSFKLGQKGDYSKIRSACQEARKHGLQYIWIDTCCIDKRSSAELQEAINSMYRYYENASVCYVHMSDLPKDCPELRDELPSEERHWLNEFSDSRWFTRGWTLQELIAPKGAVKFYSESWRFVGSKDFLIDIISQTTGIDPRILTQDASLSSMSVAQRMAWASRRKTSRVEDQAYSLLGLFNVSIPMLYGEGDKAFIRLQEEIIRTSNDQSIFAWEHRLDQGLPDGRLLATSPAEFQKSFKIRQWGKAAGFDLSNRGLRISLPIINENNGSTLAILNCRESNNLMDVFALRLRSYAGGEEYHTLKGEEQGLKRLRLVPQRHADVHQNPAVPLQITREFHPEASRVKFWLDRSEDLTTPFMSDSNWQITNVFPKAQWDLSDNVMHADNSDSFRGGLTIKTAPDELFHIALGFDTLPALEYQELGASSIGPARSLAKNSANSSNEMDPSAERLDDSEESEHSRYLPGVWAWFANKNNELAIQVQSGADRCSHTSVRCREKRCPSMRVTASVTFFLADGYSNAFVDLGPTWAKLEVTIRMERILQDTVFVVRVKFMPIYELQTFEPMQELAISAPVTTEPSIDRLKQLILADVIPPLGHLLSASQHVTSQHIWIRYPEALSLQRSIKLPWISLPYRTLFLCTGDFKYITLHRIFEIVVEDYKYTIALSDLFAEDGRFQLNVKVEQYVHESEMEPNRGPPDDPQRRKLKANKSPVDMFRLEMSASEPDGLQQHPKRKGVIAHLRKSVLLPESDVDVCVEMHIVERTPPSFACVIDLHLETKTEDVIDFGVQNLTSLVEANM